jgi:hypothetical protein
MKRKLFFCICLLNINFIYSQSIVSSNKLWNNIIHYYDNYWNWGTETIKFTTDTTINSLTYKKVERSLDENQQNWSLYGYIRENQNKQVFYKISPQDTERLLYDLNVQIHDTIDVYGIYTLYNSAQLNSMRYYVSNIDSMLIGQTYRKRINLTIPYNATKTSLEEWIDSTGPMGGILHNQYVYGGCDYYTLLCFTEDGILKFHNPSYPSCYVLTDINDKNRIDPIVLIYPNPITDISILEIKNVENFNSISICIYDLFGKVILSKSDEIRIILNSNDLPSGIYLYNLTINKTTHKRGKIIIN